MKKSILKKKKKYSLPRNIFESKKKKNIKRRKVGETWKKLELKNIWLIEKNRKGLLSVNIYEERYGKMRKCKGTKMYPWTKKNEKKENLIVPRLKERYSCNTRRRRRKE